MVQRLYHFKLGIHLSDPLCKRILYRQDIRSRSNAANQPRLMKKGIINQPSHSPHITQLRQSRTFLFPSDCLQRKTKCILLSLFQAAAQPYKEILCLRIKHFRLAAICTESLRDFIGCLS